MTENLTRRQTIAATLGIGVALNSAGCASAQTPTQSPLPATALSPRPLAFDPASVPGFSERIIRSHHENNYAGAVRRIGAIQAELSTLDLATAPGFKLNGLKREELMAVNSMILHEIHFASFGPDGVSPGGPLALDMYEHAYHMDYGSNAGAYVDAFMNVLDWRNANTAFAAAL